jgi:acetoin utilization deacetylase AcuC-like enzyme
MGFCIFNNVAIGVAHALSHYKLKRISIIDFDVHHGNGTEDIFQNEKRVLFCSIFQYPLYPLSGIETKSNHIINTPLPAGATGREFRSEIEMKWLEPINKFKPELIFFSAGFDGHYKDKISELQLTEFDFAWLTRQIKSIVDTHCSGRMISCLEGGYALDALGSCALAHINAMID